LFYIQKFVQSLLFPSNLIGFLALLGILALILRRPRPGRAALILSALLLIVGGWTPLGPAALMVLENRFPQPQLVEPVTGIIMLGGSINTHITVDRGQTALNDAGERVTAMAGLSRKFPQARILLSSGANAGYTATAQLITEAALVRDMLVGMGVEANRIEVEGQSRDTRENAEQSLLLAKPLPNQTWVLVTSASHMPRAVASFRAVGFAVVPYPVDYRTQGPANLRRPVESIAEGLQHLDLAAHEWLGLIMYRLAGRTQELLPSP
jgi:uncharacterized SAM-binding protein YcdF (DUF218 family)